MDFQLEFRITNDLLYLKNTQGTITIEEAKQISMEIRQLVFEREIRKIVVDNRELRGTWASGVNDVWMELMEFMAQHVSKCATLCENVLNEMQLNRLSRQAGTFENVQAFSDEYEALQFLEIESL